MIRILFLTLFVVALAFTPVYLLDSRVLPELVQLRQLYGDAEQLADAATTGKASAADL